MEYYLAIKKNATMSFTGKWMEPSSSSLSEISQDRKAKHHILGGA
jgi:hypothetical protein